MSVSKSPLLIKTPVILDSDYHNHLILKLLASWKKSYDKPRQHVKKQRHHFASKGPYSQSYVSVLFCFVLFSVVMYGCEIWTIKKAEC